MGARVTQRLQRMAASDAFWCNSQNQVVTQCKVGHDPPFEKCWPRVLDKEEILVQQPHHIPSFARLPSQTQGAGKMREQAFCCRRGWHLDHHHQRPWQSLTWPFFLLRCFQGDRGDFSCNPIDLRAYPLKPHQTQWAPFLKRLARHPKLTGTASLRKAIL